MVFEDVIKNHWETTVVNLGAVPSDLGVQTNPNPYISRTFWGQFCAAELIPFHVLKYLGICPETV